MGKHFLMNDSVETTTNWMAVIGHRGTSQPAFQPNCCRRRFRPITAYKGYSTEIYDLPTRFCRNSGKAFSCRQLGNF